MANAAPALDPPLAGLPDLTQARDRVSDVDLARRVLADASVRSLTLDASTDEATLRYRGCETVQRASLEWLAERFSSDAATMGSVGTVPLPPEAIERWADEETGRDSYVRTPQQATGWRRVMHLSLAGVWFSLAVLGAILPGLPCTCFLLLCSYSLCRSSKRLHQKLLDSQWFGPMLRHWRLHRGVRPGVKSKALGTMAVVIGTSLAFAPLPTAAWWAVAGLGAIGAGVVMRLRVVEC